jgi:hypothetical protein
LPGGGSDSSSGMRGTPKKAAPSSSTGAAHDADSSSRQSDQATAAAFDPAAYDMAAYDTGDMGGRSPSMNQLSTIPETHSAATSPAGNGSSSSMGGARARGPAGRPGGVGSAALQHLHQLNAQDPIVSPGRITLASKVKAARLYSSAAANVAAAQAAAAAAGGYGPTGSPGSGSE